VAQLDPMPIKLKPDVMQWIYFSTEHSFTYARSTIAKMIC